MGRSAEAGGQGAAVTGSDADSHADVGSVPYPRYHAELSGGPYDLLPRRPLRRSKTTLNSPQWRRALWIALAVNAGFFLTEIAAGLAAESVALQADALDFFGDAANYAVSLGVAGMTLAVRARAALAKGATLIAFAAWVLGSTAWHALAGTLPQAEVMGVVGVAAFVANAGVALMLYRFRTGDANMRSVWICSRNDAVGNLAVVLLLPVSSAPAPAGRI